MTPATDFPQLSVVTVALDAVDEVASTIESAEVIADEIIIVTTADAPVDVPSGRAKIITVPWQEDYSAVRNAGIDAASGKWILFLDAGESITSDAAVRVRELIDDPHPADKAYLLTIEVPPADAHGAAEQIAQHRLVPRRDNVRFTGRVRESIQPSLDSARIQTELRPWIISRSATEHDPIRKRARAHRAMPAINRAVQETGPTPDLCVALADIYSALNDQQKAAEYYRQATQTAARGTTLMLEAYYGLLTTFDGNPAAQQKQFDICVEALEVFPFDAQLLCAVGGYLNLLGKPDTACRSYETALRYGQADPQTWHLADIAGVAAASLCLTLQLLERDEDALQVLTETLARAKDSAHLHRHRLNILARLGRLPEALAQVDQIPGHVEHRDALRSAVRGACQAAQENWIPARSYLETAFKAGCRDPLCFRWLLKVLVAVGDHDEAHRVLDAWESSDPLATDIAQYRELLAAAAAPQPESIVAPQPQQTGLAQLRAAAASNPSDVDAHLRLGALYRDSGDHQAAQSIWSDFLTRVPDAYAVRAALCEMLVADDRADEAVRAFGDTNRAPAEHRPIANFILGIAAAEQADWRAALARLSEARAAGYAPTILLLRLAHVMIRMGSSHDAEEILRGIIRDEPENPAAYELLATNYRATGRAAEAQTILDHIHQKLPQPHLAKVKPQAPSDAFSSHQRQS